MSKMVHTKFGYMSYVEANIIGHLDKELSSKKGNSKKGHNHYERREQKH